MRSVAADPANALLAEGVKEMGSLAAHSLLSVSLRNP